MLSIRTERPLVLVCALAMIAGAACTSIISSGEISGELSPGTGGSSTASATTATSTGTTGSGGSSGSGGSGGAGGSSTSTTTSSSGGGVGGACGQPIAVDSSPGPKVFDGSTDGASATESGGLQCAAEGPEVVYEIAVPGEHFLSAWLDQQHTGFDTVLYARDHSGCAMSGINGAPACAASEIGSSGEALSYFSPGGGKAFVFVDGRFAPEHGPYRLTLSVATGASCQNGNAIELTLKPNAHYSFAAQTAAENSGYVDVSCAAGGAGAGTANVVYHFLPAKLPKTIVVNKPKTYIFADDACIEPLGASQCSPSGNPTLQTSSEYVWVDAGAAGMFTQYTLTVDTGELPPP